MQFIHALVTNSVWYPQQHQATSFTIQQQKNLLESEFGYKTKHHL